MSYRIKIPSKGVPVDEAHLMSGMDRLLDRLQQNRQMLIVAVVLVLLAAAIVGGVVWLDARHAAEAQDRYRQALRAYLDRPMADPVKAEKSLKQALTLFGEVVEEYPRSPSAPLALYQLGNAQMEARETAGAILTYKRFAASYGTHKILLGMVYQRLGYAHLLTGDREQAAQAFRAVLEVPGALNKDHALFELGKLEETQARPEAALAHYQDLMKTYPKSPLSSEAAVRSKALEVKQAPEPAAGQSRAPAASAAPSSAADPSPAK